MDNIFSILIGGGIGGTIGLVGSLLYFEIKGYVKYKRDTKRMKEILREKRNEPGIIVPKDPED